MRPRCSDTQKDADPPTGLVTANLSIDYAGSANVGDWMTTRCDVQRQGGRLAFANCYVYVGEQRIVRASGVFLIQEWREGGKA